MNSYEPLDLLPPPTAEISTPYGAALVTVHSPEEIEVELKRRVKINHILVSVNVRSLLDIDGHWAHITRVTRWIKRDGVWQQGHKATENAYEKVKATLPPVIEAWIAANPDMRTAAQVVLDQNVLTVAHNRIVEMAVKVTQMSRVLSEAERRFEQTNELTEQDRRVLAIHASEWALS